MRAAKVTVRSLPARRSSNVQSRPNASSKVSSKPTFTSLKTTSFKKALSTPSKQQKKNSIISFSSRRTYVSESFQQLDRLHKSKNHFHQLQFIKDEKEKEQVKNAAMAILKGEAAKDADLPWYKQTHWDHVTIAPTVNSYVDTSSTKFDIETLPQATRRLRRSLGLSPFQELREQFVDLEEEIGEVTLNLLFWDKSEASQEKKDLEELSEFLKHKREVLQGEIIEALAEERGVSVEEIHKDMDAKFATSYPILAEAQSLYSNEKHNFEEHLLSKLPPGSRPYVQEELAKMTMGAKTKQDAYIAATASWVAGQPDAIKNQYIQLLTNSDTGTSLVDDIQRTLNRFSGENTRTESQTQKQ